MPNKLSCLTCLPPHDIENSIKVGELLTLVLYDQNFQPVLPAGGNGKCVVVVRVEDGYLCKIESVFSDHFKRFVRPHGKLLPGSVVLLGSLSHLAAKGLAIYAKALVGSMSTLKWWDRELVSCRLSPSPWVAWAGRM